MGNTRPKIEAAAKDLELSGKTAVVTGSSSGIGQAIALELASAGASVVVHGHKNRNGCQETQERVRHVGADCTAILGDLSNLAWLNTFVDEALDLAKRGRHLDQ